MLPFHYSTRLLTRSKMPVTWQALALPYTPSKWPWLTTLNTAPVLVLQNYIQVQWCVRSCHTMCSFNHYPTVLSESRKEWRTLFIVELAVVYWKLDVLVWANGFRYGWMAANLLLVVSPLSAGILFLQIDFRASKYYEPNALWVYCCDPRRHKL